MKEFEAGMEKAAEIAEANSFGPYNHAAERIVAEIHKELRAIRELAESIKSIVESD